MHKAQKRIVIGLSVLQLGWKENISMGMPSVFFMQNGLYNRGFESHYITIGNKANIKESVVSGIHIHRFFVRFRPLRQIGLYSLSQWIYWLIVQIKGYIKLNQLTRRLNPDLLVAHTYYCALPVYLIAKRRNLPAVFREYGTMDLYDRLSEGIRGKIKKLNEIIAYRLPFDAFILTDDGSRTKDAAIMLGVDKRKIYFLKNGVFNPTSFPAQDVKGELVFCSAARIEKNKRMGEIVTAFSKSNTSKKAILYVIGEGQALEETKQIAKDHGVQDRVIFTGALSRDKVLGFYKSSDVVIALGSINPLLEAMTCGKAVITMDIGSTSEIVKHMENGILIKQDEISKLPYYFDLLSGDKMLRKSLGNSAKEFIKSNYLTWESRVEYEISIFENIIHRSKV